MLTVPEAAKRVGRDPETIRRWIRSGRLRARKVGTQHVIEPEDLEATMEQGGDLVLPAAWATTRSGAPMPNVVAAIARSRRGR
ncbi:MAG: helix-turn-helix domain-containing protein [Gaiellaceae bacterium]